MVEGAKNIIELISSDYEIARLLLTQKFVDEFPSLHDNSAVIEICREKELVELGTFKSNEYGLAVAKMKSPPIDTKSIKTAIALDDVSDPGNLGTIIRTADWYGIDTIFANEETADFYNPKVINASMGSFTRVQVHYLDLELFFETNSHLNVFGAVLNGDDIHNTKPDFPMVLLMGNESKGIKTSMLPFVDKKITIPRIGMAESLNVAVSTAIICDNLLKS